MSKTIRKLTLNRETLRSLTDTELRFVVGKGPDWQGGINRKLQKERIDTTNSNFPYALCDPRPLP